jgi:hypothetical protein
VRQPDDTGPSPAFFSNPLIPMDKQRLIPLIVATALFMEDIFWTR